jgi:recombination protein RecT
MLRPNEQEKLKGIQQGLMKLKPRFDICFPKNSRLDSNRLIAMVSAEMRRTPKILECNRESIEAAVSLAARLMLEPDSALGYFYLIPYKDQLQVIIGYKGLLELTMRSSAIKSIYAQEVFSNDHFEVCLGTEKIIRHKPSLGLRGDLVAVYAIAQYTSGAIEIEFMSKPEVDAVRARSKSGGQGPWVTDYAAMARKTVLRRMTKYIPRAIDAHLAIAADEAYERGEQPVPDYIEGELEVVDTETGEVTPLPKNDTITSSLTDKLRAQDEQPKTNKKNETA